MDWDTGDDFSAGGKFLEQPGQYHLVISEVHEPARNAKGERIESGVFSFTAKVLAGSVDGQVDKEFRSTFFRPKPDSKDGGEFQRKKIDRFLLAAGLITEEDRGKKGLKIDVRRAVGRQIMVKLEQNTSEKNGRTYTNLDVAGAHVYHIDDPEVKTWERDADSIAMVPAECRLVGGKPPVAQQPKVAVAAMDDATFDEI